MTKDELEEKQRELAEKIASVTKGTLLLNMRFLAKAVNRLPALPGEGDFRCDGRFVIYNPRRLLERYKRDARLPVHDYFHMLIHCIFRHWNIGSGVSRERWTAACDIAAEFLIMRIGADFCPVERADEKAEIIGRLSAQIGLMTAENIYAYFERCNIPNSTAESYCEIFRTDDHSRWFKNEDQREYEPEKLPPVIGLGNPESEEGDGNDENKDGASDGGGEESDENENGDPVGGSEDTALEEMLEEKRRAENDRLKEDWERIAKELQSELENFEKNAGEGTEHFIRALAEVNRDRCDYSAFLRKFAVRGEVIRADEDTFDQNYYSYGLSLYGNVALIEPLEYRETKLVRDFVIAVDTSGSVSDELVSGFIRKTYGILKSTESFFSRVNIYIIQCDSEIKEAVKITCAAEFEKYIAALEVKGMGGTDFRPVFEYVAELISRREFSALKGMVYFTDGFGKFPEKKPPYETAFAFLRRDYEKNGQPEIPPWAIKLILEEDDITYGK